MKMPWEQDVEWNNTVSTNATESRFNQTVRKDQTDECPLIEVDLVRCGECNRSAIDDGGNTYCLWLGALRKPTDFCSYGERRTDDQA